MTSIPSGTNSTGGWGASRPSSGRHTRAFSSSRATHLFYILPRRAVAKLFDSARARAPWLMGDKQAVLEVIRRAIALAR